jgi:hypothetical protein
MGSTIKRGAAWAVLAGVVLLGCPGCLFGTDTVGSGKDTRTWHSGRLTKVYEADHERVWKACSAAIRDFKFAIMEEKYDLQIGYLKARRADDLVVRVEVERETSTGKRTAVSVGVGLWGTAKEKQASMEIMDAIDRKMGM